MKIESRKSTIYGIKSLKTLQRVLGISIVDIKKIAGETHLHYSPFEMSTTDRPKWRRIDNPDNQLKEIQRRILNRILKQHKLPKVFFGGVSKRSNFDNAVYHKNSEVVVNIDIKNCFPNTTNTTIYSVYKDIFDFSTDISSILTQLTTYRRKLPQGAPTSSMLLNLCMIPIYLELKKLADRKQLKISLFVDDITISGKHSFLIIDEVVEILKNYGYSTRFKKVKVYRGNDIMITGIQKTYSIMQVPEKKIQSFIDLVEQLDEVDCIPDSALRSLEGKLTYVQKINIKQATPLKEKLDKAIMGKAVYNAPKARNVSIRSCKK